MIASYLFTRLHVVYLFLTVIAVYCFDEPCIDDTSCVPAGFECRARRCRCRADQFWAGPSQGCIPCPTGWINLFVFCLYHEHTSATWLYAHDACRAMSPFIDAPTRLLLLNNLNEFHFIANLIPEILTADQMKPEFVHEQHVLSSAAAFIGSRGRKDADGKFVYYWSDQPDKTYEHDSPMWCASKEWYGTPILGGQAWEYIPGVLQKNEQAFRHWSDSSKGCLASFRHETKLPFLCEIIGDPERLLNQSVTVSSSTTRRSTLTTSSKPSPTTNRPTIHVILPLITTPQPSATSTELSNWTTPITSVYLNLTTVQSDLERKRVLFIILSTVGVMILLILCVLMIYIQNRRKQSRTKASSARTKTKTGDTDEIQSNDSFDSHVTKESVTQESKRILTDTQSLTPSSKSSAQASKLARWDQMESSLFTTTLTVPPKR